MCGCIYDLIKSAEGIYLFLGNMLQIIIMFQIKTYCSKWPTKKVEIDINELFSHIFKSIMIWFVYLIFIYATTTPFKLKKNIPHRDLMSRSLKLKLVKNDNIC